MDLLRVNLATFRTARGGERKKKQWPSSSPLPPTAKCFAQQQGRKMRLSAAINAENIDRARGKKWPRMRGASPSLPYGQMYYRVAPNEAIWKPFPLLQSCVKVFLPSVENHSQNVPPTTPKLHYGTIYHPAIPETWQECFYTTLYITIGPPCSPRKGEEGINSSNKRLDDHRRCCGLPPRNIQAFYEQQMATRTPQATAFALT